MQGTWMAEDVPISICTVAPLLGGRRAPVLYRLIDPPPQIWTAEQEGEQEGGQEGEGWRHHSVPRTVSRPPGRSITSRLPTVQPPAQWRLGGARLLQR